ncbi:hypothetical protein TURU_008455 [Turdus rufiventris]|nr:hypothetical protein TURU_008455 [Turdus rufiventris]
MKYCMAGVEHQTTTEAELGSSKDLLALVQWKLWERETQAKNKSEDITSGHFDHSDERRSNKDISGIKKKTSQKGNNSVLRLASTPLECMELTVGNGTVESLWLVKKEEIMDEVAIGGCLGQTDPRVVDFKISERRESDSKISTLDMRKVNFRMLRVLLKTVFNTDDGLWQPQSPELEDYDCENDELPVNSELVLDLLLQLDP